MTSEHFKVRRQGGNDFLSYNIMSNEGPSYFTAIKHAFMVYFCFDIF